MKLNYYLFCFLWIVIKINLSAQQQEFNEFPGIYKSNQTQLPDSTSLLSAFKRGTLKGNIRYYFFATDNEKNLSDYYANAAGVSIHYETAKWYGFQFGIGSSTVFNLKSSDLTKPDSITGKSNRYEIGLFDYENPGKKSDLHHLDELFIKFNYRHSFATYGRQNIHTPLINLQDGRMKPNAVYGIWMEWNEFRNTRIQGGWLHSISPVGTSRFLTMQESIGIYPVGVNPDGSKSGYKNNISSKGTALLGIQNIGLKHVKFQFWDLYAENLFHVAMIQTDLQFNLNQNYSVIGGIQYLKEDAIGNGGNSDPSKAYIEKGSGTSCYGMKLGVKNPVWECSLNYNRIDSKGRYLIPREWGRDPFYTFMPRERNEGFGDVHAYVGKMQYQIVKAKLKTSLAFGYFDLPDVKNVALNKYGMPSYTQLNADVQYRFDGFLNGLEAHLLIVSKQSRGETYNDEKNIFNKVNLMIYNLIINYHF